MPPKCKVCDEHYWSGHPCKCGRTPENQAKEQPDDCPIRIVHKYLNVRRLESGEEYVMTPNLLAMLRGELLAYQVKQQLKRESGWQPIETAPKDGSYCRFYYGFGQEEILKWSKARQYWVNFETDVDYDAGNEGLGKPTHWMPYTDPATEIEG